MKTLAVSCLLAATLTASVVGYADDTTAKPAAATAPAATAAPAASAAPAATAAPATAPKPSTGPLTNAEASYRIGLSLGEQLKHAGIAPDALKADELARGVKDAIKGGRLTPEEGKRLNNWVLAAAAVIANKNHAAAKAFLDKNGKLPGVVTTASGLQYQVVTPGKGASPSPTDEVTVQYRGTTLDGKEFDSSYKRGQPATFPVNGVIKGWQEALVLMQPGAKWKLFVPPALAYDLKSPTPMIPPGSALIFDVELLSINAKPAQDK
jgi:FKBP-type peptidyl-prolyl cis-trans isomerase